VHDGFSRSESSRTTTAPRRNPERQQPPRELDAGAVLVEVEGRWVRVPPARCRPSMPAPTLSLSPEGPPSLLATLWNGKMRCMPGCHVHPGSLCRLAKVRGRSAATHPCKDSQRTARIGCCELGAVGGSGSLVPDHSWAFRMNNSCAVPVRLRLLTLFWEELGVAAHLWVA
jgi:hypothetical protein